jgi:flagellar motor switch protein FliG
MGRVAPEVAHEILEEYARMVSTPDRAIQGGTDVAKRVLVKAFGDSSAKDILQNVAQLQKESAGQLDALERADPTQLVKFLEGEHPQTIALVLAHLDAKKVPTLVMKLPEQIRAESVKRLAQLRQFSPEMAERVFGVLNRRMQALGEQSHRRYAGIKSVADVMNRLDPNTSKSILETIEHEDPTLAVNIRNLMFTFEDLIGIPDVSIREWLGAMDKKTLACALKGASNDLKEHIFRAMSSRAVEMLKEDIDVLGPVRAKDVSQAQQEAVTLLRRLESEGKIVLKAEGDDEYVV